MLIFKTMKKYIIIGLALAFSLTSCLKDLDQDPSIDPDSINESSVQNNLDYAKQTLAKVYASLALTGKKVLLTPPIFKGLMKVLHSSAAYCSTIKSCLLTKP